ncbi:uncharacterized protein LOC109202521 [Oreochromis niloticus]|uniref:uncharacterized protein LOC109202521 n=1 Tax=Oreochromis niloticus TaxID=8128 RepID=UPI00090503E9|nr:uncharacterized protein LOC109202521 [Oreochromis niloticus]
MFDSLMEGKESLQEMAISQSVGIDSDIKKVILDDVLWERVSSSQKILKPIAAAIAKIEGDGAILSDVQCLFAELKEEIQTILPTSLLLKAEETAVVKSLEQRREFCMKPVHAAAYMLDPKYYDKGILSGEEINSAYAVITAMSDHLGLDKGKVLGSLAKYRTKQGLWKGDGIWQSCQHISAVLGRLTNVRVEKLVGIRANLRLFEPDTEPSSTRLESDTEEEDSELDAEEVDMLLDDDEVQEESTD